MPFGGRMLQLREELLNRLLRVGEEVLNDRASDPQRPAQEMLPLLEQVMADITGTYVSDGGQWVDYQRLAGSELMQVVGQEVAPALHAFDPARLADRSQQLSFWINLYNLLVLDAVLHFRVEKSVTAGPAGILRFFRRAAYRVGGQRVSLEDLEQGILRANRGHPYLPGPQFGPTDPRRAWVLAPFDPRIHWGLNCASRSCPPLRAFRAGAIDRQLDVAAQQFVRSHVAVSPAAGTIRVSSIFKWFSRDFGGKAGAVDYLCDCLSPGEECAWLTQNRQTVRLDFQPYDWRLNTDGNKPPISPSAG